MSTKIENRIVVLLVFISVLVQTVILHLYPLSISNDSFGYINLANNLFDSYRSFERSIGYPFLVALSGVGIDGTLIILVYIQSLMAISIPILCYFSMRPLGFWYGNLAAALGLINLFPFTMATQVLTETPYMFCIALLGFFASRYFFTRSLLFLICAVGATFLLTFVRVSGSTQFICLISGIIILIIHTRFKEGSFDRKLLIHSAIAVALFLFFTTIYNTTTSRSTKYSMPHFMFNWVYRSGTNIHYGAIHPNNGPATKELFTTIGAAVKKSPPAYKWLSSVARAPIKYIGESQAVFDSKDADLLVNDLIYNNKHYLRSWWIEAVLIGHVGIEKTANLLFGAIKEAFIAHPELILKRLKTVSINSYDVLTTRIGVNPIGPTTSWDQVPKPGTIRGEIRAKSFAQWIAGMDQLTGPRQSWRTGYGYFPDSWDSAVTALIQGGNYVAMGHYLSNRSMQLQRLVWFVMIAGLLFLFWSSNPALCATLIAAGTLPPIVSVFISEVDTRHLWMAWPIQLLAATLVLEAVVNVLRQVSIKLPNLGTANWKWATGSQFKFFKPSLSPLGEQILKYYGRLKSKRIWGVSGLEVLGFLLILGFITSVFLTLLFVNIKTQTVTSQSKIGPVVPLVSGAKVLPCKTLDVFGITASGDCRDIYVSTEVKDKKFSVGEKLGEHDIKITDFHKMGAMEEDASPCRVLKENKMTGEHFAGLQLVPDNGVYTKFSAHVKNIRLTGALFYISDGKEGLYVIWNFTDKARVPYWHAGKTKNLKLLFKQNKIDNNENILQFVIKKSPNQRLFMRWQHLSKSFGTSYEGSPSNTSTICKIKSKGYK